MANIKFSSSVLADIQKFGNDITPPGEGIQGSVLVNQEVAESFKANPTQEVTLLSFVCTETPRPRFTMVGEAKNIANPTGKYQLRGKAKIRVGSLETEVMMHVHTIAFFGDQEKANLTGQVGEINSGKNAGKMWLLLRGGEVSTENLISFVQAHVGEVVATL